MHNDNEIGYIPDGLYSLRFTTNPTECALKSESDMFILPRLYQDEFSEFKNGSKEVAALFNKITYNESGRSLVINLLSAFEKGVPYNRIPVPLLINRLFELIKVNNIQFIIMDNSQGLNGQSSNHLIKQTLDLLESLSIKLNIPVVLCGHHSFYNLVKTNKFFNNRYNVFEKGLNISANRQSLYFNVS